MFEVLYSNSLLGAAAKDVWMFAVNAEWNILRICRAEGGEVSGSGRPVSPAGVPTEGVHTRGAVQMSDLQSILSGLSSLPVPPGTRQERDTGRCMTV
jgi:hypothetical protein